MPITDARIKSLREIAQQYRFPEERARRIFLEEPSFALAEKREIEFQIKTAISSRYQVPYRSIVFCGSAHLGFSPIKDRDFHPGTSDLDVAIVNMETFQGRWKALVGATKAFTDLTPFRIFTQPAQVALEVQEMMARRGLLHLHNMPTSKIFNDDKAFFDRLSISHRNMFGKVNASFYMNEYAFCWKQTTSLNTMMGIE